MTPTLSDAMYAYREAVKAGTMGVMDAMIDDDCKRLEMVAGEIGSAAMILQLRFSSMSGLSARPKAAELATAMAESISFAFADGDIGATAWAVVCAAARGE